MSDLLAQAHLAAPHELPRLFQTHAGGFGTRSVTVYLADLQQRSLVPFVAPDGPGVEAQIETLSIDSTLAGRAFQHTEPAFQPLEESPGEIRVWMPLLNGTERLGVVALTVPEAVSHDDHAGAAITRLRLFASMCAELVSSKSLVGDTIVRLRRTGAMGLAAEMQWSLLPPLAFASAEVTVVGGLEPAYEVAGDSIDYAVEPHLARFALFDAMGHGLPSAQLVSWAVATYRNSRRGNMRLTATAQAIDAIVASSFAGEGFVTGVVAELDTATGLLSWVNAGHPEPLLMRDGRLLKTLHVEPHVPFGLWAELQATNQVLVGAESLEPADIILLYSDGVVEARSPTGDPFGQDRLVDLLTRNLAAGLCAQETMRRLVRSLLEHQQHQLSDDATLLMVQWRAPTPTGRLL